MRLARQPRVGPRRWRKGVRRIGRNLVERAPAESRGSYAVVGVAVFAILESRALRRGAAALHAQ